MGFVHRRTGEVLVFGELPPTPKCTSRPDCPCDFCVRVRVEITEGRSEKDEQKTIAEDFLRSYSQTKLARENLVKMTSATSFLCLRREEETICLLCRVAEGRSERDTQERLAEVFIDSYLPPARGPDRSALMAILLADITLVTALAAPFLPEPSWFLPGCSLLARMQCERPACHLGFSDADESRGGRPRSSLLPATQCVPIPGRAG